MTNNEKKNDFGRTKSQELHLELMTLREEYSRLLKDLIAWNKKFAEYWLESNSKLDGKE